MSVKINAKTRKNQKRPLLDLEGLNDNAECFVYIGLKIKS